MKEIADKAENSRKNAGGDLIWDGHYFETQMEVNSSLKSASFV